MEADNFEPCEICEGVDFYKVDDGYFYCKECHTRSPSLLGIFGSSEIDWVDLARREREDHPRAELYMRVASNPYKTELDEKSLHDVFDKQSRYYEAYVQNSCVSKLVSPRLSIHQDLTQMKSETMRRSKRRPNEIVLEKQRDLENIISGVAESSLDVILYPGKGRGVAAKKDYRAGEMVVEYAGDLISCDEAKSRELSYLQDPSIGSYMYYFKYKEQLYCIDATAESDRLGRLINHSRRGNLKPHIVVHDNLRIIFSAKNAINVGDELTYDYGDRSKQSLISHPWLGKS